MHRNENFNVYLYALIKDGFCVCQVEASGTDEHPDHVQLEHMPKIYVNSLYPPLKLLYYCT